MSGGEAPAGNPRRRRPLSPEIRHLAGILVLGAATWLLVIWAASWLGAPPLLRTIAMWIWGTITLVVVAGLAWLGFLDFAAAARDARERQERCTCRDTARWGHQPGCPARW